MTAKRFTYDYEDDKYYDKGFFKDNEKELYKDELLELLNTLHEENKKLKQMEALNNLTHYSTEICLKIPTEFIDKDTGEDWDFTDKLQENIDCLLKDDGNEVIIAKDYWNNNQTIIDIKVEK